MKYRLLVSEQVSIPESLQRLAEIDVFNDLWRDNAKLAVTADGYDALIVRNMTKVDAALLELFTSVKVIGRLGAGIENIDIQHARQCEIPVVYAPVQNTNAVAEFCVAQVFNALRHLPAAINEAQQGIWNRGKYLTLGREVRGCTIGVIGFGNIGQSFAEKMAALGANVLVYNKTASKVTTPFQYTELETLLKKSDIVSIHLPGGSATQHFIDEERIGLMKEGAFVLNSSRGSVVCEQGLLEALNSGRLGGAILDVRAVEPAVADALAMHENVYPTPHIAAFTSESQTEITKSVVEDVLSILDGKAPQFPAT